MTALLAILLTLMLAVFLLALAGIPLFGLLLQVTWPIRWSVNAWHARRAMREFDREYAKLTHPSAR